MWARGAIWHLPTVYCLPHNFIGVLRHRLLWLLCLRFLVFFLFVESKLTNTNETYHNWNKNELENLAISRPSDITFVYQRFNWINQMAKHTIGTTSKWDRKSNGLGERKNRSKKNYVKRSDVWALVAHNHRQSLWLIGIGAISFPLSLNLNETEVSSLCRMGELSQDFLYHKKLSTQWYSKIWNWWCGASHVRNNRTDAYLNRKMECNYFTLKAIIIFSGHELFTRLAAGESD